MNLTLRYAIFRHKNKMMGRCFEFLMVALAMTACAAMLISSNVNVLLSALGTIFFCIVSFWFFNRAEKMRRTMAD
ncbi:hypothetical protein [Vibrio hippocampi]|nr:hypothetical protein [Vibrio hippocampi]